MTARSQPKERREETKTLIECLKERAAPCPPSHPHVFFLLFIFFLSILIACWLCLSSCAVFLSFFRLHTTYPLPLPLFRPILVVFPFGKWRKEVHIDLLFSPFLSFSSVQPITRRRLRIFEDMRYSLHPLATSSLCTFFSSSISTTRKI